MRKTKRRTQFTGKSTSNVVKKRGGGAPNNTNVPGFHPNLAIFNCLDLAIMLLDSVKSSSPVLCQHVDMFYICSSFYWHLNKCPFANIINLEFYVAKRSFAASILS